MESQNLDESAILRKIQEVETEVERSIARALEETQKRVEKAREEADQLFLSRCESIEAECRQWLQNEKAEGEREAASVILSAKKEAEVLRKLAGSKIEKAANHVLGRVYPDISGDFK